MPISAQETVETVENATRSPLKKSKQSDNGRDRWRHKLTKLSQVRKNIEGEQDFKSRQKRALCLPYIALERLVDFSVC